MISHLGKFAINNQKNSRYFGIKRNVVNRRIKTVIINIPGFIDHKKMLIKIEGSLVKSERLDPIKIFEQQ
jgi:hypothetical protein